MPPISKRVFRTSSRNSFVASNSFIEDSKPIHELSSSISPKESTMELDFDTLLPWAIDVDPSSPFLVVTFVILFGNFLS